MKKIIIYFGWIILYFQQYDAISQQRAQFSQYMNNLYLVNPAAGGTDDYTDIKASYRAQWVGMDGAPVSYYLSGHTPIGMIRKGSSKNYIKSYHTVGGLACNDITGPTSRFNMVGSYSYNLQVQRNLRVSAGAFMGLQQYTLNSEVLKFHDPGDNTTLQRVIVPDIAVGIWAYSNTMFVGFSVSQVFQNKLHFDYTRNTSERDNYSKLNSHYYLTGGVKLPINKQLMLVPSLLIKYVTPAKPAIDINAKLKYEELFWVGASYRNLDSFIGMAGININELFLIGYSYDATISKLSKYNSGSHEILLGVKIKGKRKQIGQKNFW